MKPFHCLISLDTSQKEAFHSREMCNERGGVWGQGTTNLLVPDSLYRDSTEYETWLASVTIQLETFLDGAQKRVLPRRQF